MSAGAGAPNAGEIAGAGAPLDEADPTSVCAGGEVGMDSDSVSVSPLAGGGGRNLAYVILTVPSPNKVLNFKTWLTVPEEPAERQTLFIWPGLQHRGGNDPGRVGNGVLQPVLTWGPSCASSAPASSRSYSSWWIAAMYVNISTRAAGPSGCAAGDAMDTPVGDRLVIEFDVQGNEWTQTVTNLSSMEKVDLTWDLEGQDQNMVIWDIEVPSSARPASDTFFEKSVLTFAEPVTSCQPTNVTGPDYYSAPVRSPDGLHCCFDKIILKKDRN